MVVATVLGLSLISVGLTVFVAPKFGSEMFGMAAIDNPARAYVYATGLRDITLGCLLLALSFLRAGARILGAVLMILALIPIGDAIIVYVNASQLSALALSLHLTSAVVFLVLGFCLRSARNA
jgi:Domain of unknown function (DUF4267)